MIWGVTVIATFRETCASILTKLSHEYSSNVLMTEGNNDGNENEY